VLRESFIETPGQGTIHPGVMAMYVHGANGAHNQQKHCAGKSNSDEAFHGGLLFSRRFLNHETNGDRATVRVGNASARLRQQL
jgi:hypothetical protein